MDHTRVCAMAGLVAKVIYPIDRAGSGRSVMVGPASLQRVDYPTTRAGRGYLADKVTINGVGVRRRVLCFEAQTGRLVASTWSSLAGDYRIDNLAGFMAYLVVSVDHKNEYDPVGKAPLYPTRYA